MYIIYPRNYKITTQILYQPYHFCFSTLSKQPRNKKVCSLNLPFYSSQPMLPVIPLIFGYSSHFMKTPVPAA